MERFIKITIFQMIYLSLWIVYGLIKILLKLYSCTALYPLRFIQTRSAIFLFWPSHQSLFITVSRYIPHTVKLYLLKAFETYPST